MKSKKYIIILENLISLFFLKFADLLIPIVLVPFLLGKVGVVNYGYYVFANSVFVYLLNISQYGFFLSAVRDISVNRNDKIKVNEIFNNVFSTKLFIVSINISILFFLVLFIPALTNHWQMYFFIGLMLVGDLFTPSWFFYGIEKMRFITLMNVALKSTFLFLVMWFIGQENDYVFIPFYQSVGYVLVGVASFYLTLKKYKVSIKLLSLVKVWKELKYGFSSFLSLISPSIFTNTVIFVVGVYLNSPEVAMSQAAIVVISCFGGINAVMTNVFYPFVNNNVNFFKKVKAVFLIFGAILSVVMYTGASYIVDVWVGEKFDSVTLENIKLLIKVASLSPFLMSIVSVYGVNGLLVIRKDKTFSYISVFSTLFFILFAFILTPIFSFLGSFIALILGRLLYALLSMYYFKVYSVEE